MYFEKQRLLAAAAGSKSQVELSYIAGTHGWRSVLPVAPVLLSFHRGTTRNNFAAFFHFTSKYGLSSALLEK